MTELKKQLKRIGKLGLFSSFAILCTMTVERLFFLQAKRKQPLEEDMETYYWNHHSIGYHSYGSGRPLLLLHNTCVGASSKEWEKNIEILAERYHVYTIDLPGFGASQKQNMIYTAYHYALFLTDFIEEVVKRPVSILASSTSASFALMAYEQNPKNIRKLLLISPTGMEEQPFATEEDNEKRKLLQSPILGTGLFLKASSKKALKQQLQQTLFFSKEKVTQELILQYYYASHLGGENARHCYACGESKFMNTSIKEAISHLKIPCLIAWGEHNLVNPIANLEKIQELHPNGEYVLFEQTRLLPHYENPTEFNQIAKEFLQ